MNQMVAQRAAILLSEISEYESLWERATKYGEWGCDRDDAIVWGLLGAAEMEKIDAERLKKIAEALKIVIDRKRAELERL